MEVRLPLTRGTDPNTAPRATPHPAFGRRERNGSAAGTMTGPRRRGGDDTAESSRSSRTLLSTAAQSLLTVFKSEARARLVAGIESLTLALATADPEGTAVMRVCRKVCSHIVVRASHEGVEHALSLLGNWAGRARALFLQGKTNVSSIPPLRFLRSEARSQPDFLLAQFSYLKRALPVASERKVNASLREHKARLLDPLKTPEPLLEGFRHFCALWAHQRLPAKPEPFGVTGLSSSACTTHSVRVGGHVARAREILESLPEGGPPTRPPGLLPQEWWSGWSRERLLSHCRALYGGATPPLPQAVAVVVRERGLKARIVTKIDTEACLLGHQARLRLKFGLKRTPEVSAVLRGAHREFLGAFSGEQGYILSSDLTAASDLLPLDLVGSGVEGLAQSGRFLPDELLGLRVNTGSFSASWGRLGCGETQCGILMGAPPTWGLLCLVHLYWLDAAQSLARGLVKARICGDDLVASMSSAQRRAYEERVASCHGILSSGKHSYHRTHGVFLEQLFIASRVIKKVQLESSVNITVLPGSSFLSDEIEDLHLLKTLPLRPFVLLQTSVVAGRRQVSKGTLPTPLAIGSVSDGLMRAGFPANLIGRATWALWPGLPGFFRKLGVPPFLPSCLGGGGLLCLPEGWDLSIRRFSRIVRASVVALCCGNGSVSFMDLTRLPPPLLVMALEEAEELLPRHPHRVSGKSPSPWLGKIPWHDMGTLADFRITAALAAQENYLLQMPMEFLGKPLRVTVGSWAQHVHQKRLALSRKAWWCAANRASFSLFRAVEKYNGWPHVWLPGSPDPDYPGIYGIPMYIDCADRKSVV